MVVGRSRQHLGERRVAVVVALEVEQRVEQRAPLALGDADREQEQDREVGGLLDLDAAWCRYAVTSVAGMPRLSRPPLSATPGVTIDTLIGSSMQ